MTRAGTDYGAQERTIEEKLADVERQLERGEASIVFDVDTGTTNIVPAASFRRSSAVKLSIGRYRRWASSATGPWCVATVRFMRTTERSLGA